MGACIPERERVSGTVPFDVRIVLHDNPGRLTYVWAVFKTGSTETTVARRHRLGRRCGSGPHLGRTTRTTRGGGLAAPSG